MEYKIHESSNIYDLKSILLEHYDLSEIEYDHLNDIELSDPMQVTHMDQCLDILKDIKSKNEKILIVGDYDCDGICATTILCMAFEKCQFDYGFYIPNRLCEGYGLNVGILQKALDKGYRNVITVDNGVKAHEAMQFAKENNMRLILSDHHTYEENEIDCTCFIHPFLKDDMFKNCSGAGMALQIARCMIPDNKDIVCYAALATIADCMDVTRENRNIIRKGMEYLNDGCAAPLHALKNKPQDLFDVKMMSYTIIPKLNAMGRLSDVVNVNNAVRYLMLTDTNVIYSTARQINQINELRKEKTSEMEKIANSSLTNQPFEMIVNKDFHEGIVGLLASRLASNHNRPFLVLSELDHEYKGSIRSVQGFHLIEYFKDFHGFKKFGGHAQAAGVTLLKENYQDLIDYIQSHPVKIDEDGQIIECEKVDESAFSIQSVMDYMNLAPFGNGFEEISFYVENIQMKSKVSLSNGKYYKVISSAGIEYLFFKSNLISKIKDGMHVIGKVRLSDFRGVMKVNVIVDDVLEENVHVQ